MTGIGHEVPQFNADGTMVQRDRDAADAQRGAAIARRNFWLKVAGIAAVGALLWYILKKR